MNSGDFEMRITDRRSSGRSLVKRYYGQVSDFSDDIQTIIAEPGDSFPATKIGRSLYDLLKHQFEKRRIETEGFVLRSTVDTKVDGISCQLVRVYTGSKFNGYIFKISTAAKDKDFLIDVTKLTLGSPNTAILSPIAE